MNKIVLIVDDELRIRKLIADFLMREGYSTLEADNGSVALDLLSKVQIDLVILDVMMPEHDGWTVCRELRKKSNIPVIMLTAKGEEVDQLFAFEIGADEYVTKPFSPKVLTARVNALFRRIESDKATVYDGLEINTAARQVSINDQSLDLSPKEYELLTYLTENSGKALSRQQILNQVWSYDYFGDLRTVDTHINRLRTKLGDKSALVQTIRGYGYRFEAEK
jgi:two-component system response regulator ResD